MKVAVSISFTRGFGVLAAITLLLLSLSAFPGVSQDAAPDITLIEVPENPDYARSVRLSRLQSRLNYVEETSGPIPMDAAANISVPETAEPSNSRPFEWTAFEFLSRLALLIVIGLGLYALLKHGGFLTGKFRSPQDAHSASARDHVGNGHQPDIPRPETEALFTRLRAMPDREEALMLLIGHTLEAAGRQHALRLRRSETAREFLNRLPAQWQSMTDLRRITMTEELVQFGGRPLPEKTFEDCLRRAYPILTGAPV